MSKSYRIKTKPGEDDGYLKVNLDLNQNYDFLEILSLKISQNEEYQGFCADYGVIAGRIDINNGFGVPNVKVSIFVPIEESDLDNPVISSLYPYTSPADNEKNDRGIRYNLLPNKQQNFDHTPVGTFPSKREMLDNKTTLEIYEKYYKYTTTTNEAGDFILFGVPVGEHTLHYDMDVSDIGFISARPYELISQGYSEDLFDSRFKFKSSNNLNNLTQVFSENVSVEVLPYWCDSLKVGNTIGIVRKDISIDLELIPTAIFTGSIFSDDEKDSLNKNCRPDRDMGKMDEVITNSGKIEAIRRTTDGTIESYEIKGDSIDDNGNWSIQIPMNLRKVVTDEFGNLIPSPDGIKGIATESDMRFRISMDASDTDKRLRQRVKFLVPNMTGNYNFGPLSYEDLRTTDKWVKNEQLSTITVGTPYENDLTNQYNYIEEFFTFRWKKVYTVKQYIGRYQKSQNDETRGFIGIKDIVNGAGVNKFPSNRMDTSIHPIYTILCVILSLFGLLVGVINGIIQFINGLITSLCNVRIPFGIESTSAKKARIKVKYRIYKPNNDNDGWDQGSNNNSNWSNKLDMDYVSDGDFDINSTGLNLSPSDLDVYFNSPYTSGTVNGGYGNFTSLNGWAALNTTDFSGSGQVVGNIPGRFPTGGDSPNCSTQNCFCPKGAPYGSSGRWCYNYGSCYNFDQGTTSTLGGACRKWKFDDSNMGNSITSADKQTDDTLKQECKDDPDRIYFLGRCWGLKYTCLISKLLCKKCNGYCPDGNEGCNTGTVTGSEQCCDDGKCCIKIPLIGLKCAEEEITIKPSIIPNGFAGGACNATYIRPFSCYTCGGIQTPVIKDWVSCVLEPVATFLKMLKFDFYNDWVGGSLYFPLIKRKYKVRTSKKKFGQIKKDKFCHYNCRSRVYNDPPNYQGNEVYTQHRIKLKLISTSYAPVTINVNGCNINIEGDIVTEYYGETNTTQNQNLNSAARSLTLKGYNSSDEKCQVRFDNYSSLDQTLGNGTFAGLQVFTEERESASVFGEPNYVKTEDAFGQETWENQGGYGMHKNICDPTRLIERKEYFKTSLDCTNKAPTGAVPEGELDGGDDPIPTYVSSETYDKDEVVEYNGDYYKSLEDDNQGNTPSSSSSKWELLDLSSNAPCLVVCPTLPNDLSTSYLSECCQSTCGSNSVAGCNAFCPCGQLDGVANYNGMVLEHGLVKWYDNELYYASIVPKGDTTFNTSEYKGNLLLPTTIMELGSTSYCDIDDVPFIMDKLQPTTFQVSTESIKYKTSVINSSSDPLQYELEYGDDKNGGLNLRAYVDFSCIATTCVNTLASVNQSQIGVDLLDKNDLDIEIGNCFLRFEHEPEVREYFCRRFSGYKNNDLDVHYVSPSTNQFDNNYQTYSPLTLVDDPAKEYKVISDGQSNFIPSTYNDGDSFIPGDACGYGSGNNTDYFYGIAAGQTSTLINFPNSNNTINFGDGNTVIDDVDDNINSNPNVNGIRYNRSQTPYYLYFGLIPGKTALHKTVGKFFADKINVVTLQGLTNTDDDANSNTQNRNNIRKTVENPFSIYKTCLGEQLIPNPLENDEVPLDTSIDGDATSQNTFAG